jgi:hypothetical protein
MQNNLYKKVKQTRYDDVPVYPRHHKPKAAKQRMKSVCDLYSKRKTFQPATPVNQVPPVPPASPLQSANSRTMHLNYGVSVSFTTACRGGLARRSSSSTTSLPLSSLAILLFAIDSVTHAPNMTLLLSSTSAKSDRRGDSGSNQGCSKSALKVGLFRGILFKLQSTVPTNTTRGQDVPLRDESLGDFREFRG